MKNSVIKNNKGKSVKELHTMIAEKKAALRTFRFSVAGSNTRNVKEGNHLKKDIARLLTLVNQKVKEVKTAK
jgi:ribosomal protein L29